MTNSAQDVSAAHQRSKDGKDQPIGLCGDGADSNGPRQRTLCYLGELETDRPSTVRKHRGLFNSRAKPSN